jgi:hypothetical protein
MCCIYGFSSVRESDSQMGFASSRSCSCPWCEKPLLSISSIAESGIGVKFENTRVLFDLNGIVVAEAVLRVKLFVLRLGFSTVLGNAMHAKVSQIKSVKMLHKVTNHLSIGKLKHLVAATDFLKSIVLPVKYECTACMQGKFKQTPHKRSDK